MSIKLFNKTTIKKVFIAVISLTMVLVGYNFTFASSTATYTIGPGSKPCNKTFLKYTTYNSKTRQYYLIRSYMEKFEKNGGGTLVLKKGTYNMPVTVYIPKNVTIKFSDGVCLNKTSSTGTSKVKPSKSMFMLCAPSKAKAANKYKPGQYKYGYKKYGGVGNVKLLGTGKVTVNMNYLKGGIAFDVAHTNSVTVDNIYFKKSNTGHFMEIDASKNVTVSNCTFKYAKNSGSSIKEAINLDTPDLKTKGFNAPWSSFDKTADNNVVIKSCTFSSLYRAVGTHNYSYGHPHENITIQDCNFDNIKDNAISSMYWYKTKITGSSFKNIARGYNYRAILGGGTKDINVTDCTFDNLDRVAQFYSWKDDGYSLINADITSENEDNFINGNNKYSDMSEYFIRVNVGWDSSSNGPDWTNYSRIELYS